MLEGEETSAVLIVSQRPLIKETQIPNKSPLQYACKLVCLDSVHTLEIIARILSEVVNRDRLCCTNTVREAGFRKVGGCQAP